MRRRNAGNRRSSGTLLAKSRGLWLDCSLHQGYLCPANLGGLINLVGNTALGDTKARSANVLGHVFECFLSGRAAENATEAM